MLDDCHLRNENTFNIMIEYFNNIKIKLIIFEVGKIFPCFAFNAS